MTATSAGRPRRTSPSVRRNRREWDRQSDWYDQHNRESLERHGAQAWGLWRIPESEARWLGPVRGRRVLELGCGAARWSIGLRRRGAQPVGIDLSAAQLGKARDLMDRKRIRIPLVRADAERLPFRDEAFDLVFCDWGALTFSDPRRTIPECARVLRPGGYLVFATGTAFGLVSWNERSDRLTRRLIRPYFGPMRRRVGRLDEFRPTASEWFDLFDRNGLRVDRFAESRAGARMQTSYLSARDLEWARRWPMEYLWRVRKGSSDHRRRPGG